jgi:chemotaxis protein CheD
MDKIVGIGGIAISDTMGDRIKTYSLASCVAVTAYCPAKHTAGMIHVALPEHTRQKDWRNQPPCYYATLGVPLLLHQMCVKYKCPKETLEIELFGGADSIKQNDMFRIGMENVKAVIEMLKQLDVNYLADEIGGTNSRTLELDVATGGKMIQLQPLII